MKSNPHFSQIASQLLMAALAAMLLHAFAFPAQVQARSALHGTLPSLAEFIEQVTNGDAETLRGAYVPGVLALPIVQQPPGNSAYVSPMSSNLTQFSMADKAGNVGLLAHNYLAGSLFFDIEPQDRIILVYGNARTETYVVEKIHQYEALPNGMYKNVEAPNSMNIGELFETMYGGQRHVTLQTCIAKDDRLNWGRLFIVAEELDHKVTPALAAPTSIVAPPPPPTAAPPVLLLGWPLTRLRLGTYRNSVVAQP
jgi:hypothetical protein